LKKLFPLIALVVFVFLSSCNPFAAGEIRERAKADQIAAQTLQESLNQEQARKFAEDQHAFEVQEAARVQAIKDSAVETAKQTANLFVRIAGFVAVLSVCTFMLGTTLTVNSTVKGMGLAMVRAADVRANRISLNPATRQYDVFLNYVGGGRYSLVNPNTNSVTLLDTRNDPDRQMIAAMAAVQYAGVLSAEASKSDDPAGVSIIKAPAIEVTQEMITLARELRGANE
jgi:hypothetical protein